MHFEEIVGRLTGISCPIFGISWNPPMPERTYARQIISELETHRVLFSDYQFEVLSYCVRSVLSIKYYLSSKRSEMIENNIDDTSVLYSYVTAMLKASNHFLDRCEKDSLIQLSLQESYSSNSWNSFHLRMSNLSFTCALGELRNEIGLMVGQIAKGYGLSVDSDLATIIPE